MIQCRPSQRLLDSVDTSVQWLRTSSTWTVYLHTVPSTLHLLVKKQGENGHTCSIPMHYFCRPYSNQPARMSKLRHYFTNNCETLHGGIKEISSGVLWRYCPRDGLRWQVVEDKEKGDKVNEHAQKDDGITSPLVGVSPKYPKHTTAFKDKKRHTYHPATQIINLLRYTGFLVFAWKSV